MQALYRSPFGDPLRRPPAGPVGSTVYQSKCPFSLRSGRTQTQAWSPSGCHDRGATGEGALSTVPEIRGTAGRWHFLSLTIQRRMGPTAPGAETVDCYSSITEPVLDGGCALRGMAGNSVLQRREWGRAKIRRSTGPGDRRLCHRRADVQRMHAGQHSPQLTGSALNHHPGWP